MASKYEFFDYTCFRNSLVLKQYLQARDIRRYYDDSEELLYHLNMYTQFKAIFTSKDYPYPPPGDINRPITITNAQAAWMTRSDVPEDVAYMFFLSKGRC